MIFRDVKNDSYYMNSEPAAYILCYDFEEDENIELAKLWLIKEFMNLINSLIQF